MKHMSLFKLFVAAGVVVWASPYVLIALSNTLIPLLITGALPGTRYTFSPYAMIIVSGCGALFVGCLLASWALTARRRQAPKKEAPEVTLKGMRISTQTSQRSNGQHFSRQEA